MRTTTGPTSWKTVRRPGHPQQAHAGLKEELHAWTAHAAELNEQIRQLGEDLGKGLLGPRPAGPKRTSCVRRWVTANSGTATSRTRGVSVSPARCTDLSPRFGSARGREPPDAQREGCRSAMTEAFDVNENSEVYYSGSYWNDFEIVRSAGINGPISGEPTASRLYETRPGRPSRTYSSGRSILNCGNGWVERVARRARPHRSREWAWTMAAPVR